MERPKRRPLPGSAASDLSATTSIKTVGRIMPLETPDDLPTRWRGTPLEEFVAAHNFQGDIESCTNPRMLLVSCIEFRFRPIIPSGFSYVMRTAGGRLSNLNGAEFALSYVLSKGVRHIALVGHNDCGMTKIGGMKPQLIQALVEQGWDRSKASDFIEKNMEQFSITDEIDSLKKEFMMLREEFKNVVIAPLFASLSSERLHLPSWYRHYDPD